VRDVNATVSVINSSRTFGLQGGTRTETTAGALWKGTPGIYGALFDTAISTVQETIASVRTAMRAQSSVRYSDNAKLGYPSKTELGAALPPAASPVTTGTG